MVGTTAGGTIRPARRKALTTLARRSFRRCRTYPTIEARTTSNDTEATVMVRLLRIALRRMRSLASNTALKFSSPCHSEGRDNPSSEASLRLFIAVTKMKRNGMTKTRMTTATARMSSQARFNHVMLQAPFGA